MFGIITIALGEERYIKMAKMLALSLKLNAPGLKHAVITDAEDGELEGLYDILIPYDPQMGKGIAQKLNIDRYSPFDETLFIDADCLVFKPLDSMIALCRQHQFVVFGSQISSGDWYMDVAKMCQQFGVASIPLFNGGTYYFKSQAIATPVYRKARELAADYAGLGFHPFRGHINEEPIMAVAMAMNDIEAVDDKGIGMRTPIGIKGALTADILYQKCAFIKDDEYTEPAILHFAGSYASAFHYKRETAKLRMICHLPFLNKWLVSVLVNLSFNIPYGTLVLAKRIIKMIVRKEKFDMAVMLPVYSNQ